MEQSNEVTMSRSRKTRKSSVVTEIVQGLCITDNGCILFQNLTNLDRSRLSDEIELVRLKRTHRSFWS